jgi:hypothetical protein
MLLINQVSCVLFGFVLLRTMLDRWCPIVSFINGSSFFLDRDR